MEELANLPVNIPPGYGALMLLFALLITWVKLKPAMEKIRSEDSISLRGDLMTRVRQLEALLTSERKDCDDKLEASQKAYDDKLSAMQQTHDREIKDMRDRVDFLTDALLATKQRAQKD